MRKAFQSSRGAWRLAVAIASAIVAAGCSASGIPQATGAKDGSKAVSHITHVVIIIEENRTFDNLFNGFPGADTVRAGYDHLGRQVPLVSAPLDGMGDWSHSTKYCSMAYDGGKMDGFDLDRPINTGQPSNYSFVQASDVTTYWAMASQYSVSDRMFESECGPSFPSHQYLIAGQSGLDEDPSSGGAWGCDTPIPNPPCFGYNSLGEDADAAGVSWRYYCVGEMASWDAYDAIRAVRYGPDWAADISYPETNFLSDIKNGDLAAITWITPSCADSDHHGCIRPALADGPAWVASVVDAIGESPDWDSTAIFVTWDDWGGWYDHVPPQQLYPDGLGFRVPLIVISPFARHGYVSHVTHEFGSILHFTEVTFDLPSLGTRDATSDDLSDMFDFSQRPGVFTPFAHGTFDINDTSPPDDD
jgi:phospholipase C